MGKTYRRDGNFKKARKDKNFKKSKKFKQLQSPNNHPGKPHQIQGPEDTYGYDVDYNIDP